jgi:hypothetical protein
MYKNDSNNLRIYLENNNNNEINELQGYLEKKKGLKISYIYINLTLQNYQITVNPNNLY